MSFFVVSSFWSLAADWVDQLCLVISTYARHV